MSEVQIPKKTFWTTPYCINYDKILTKRDRGRPIQKNNPQLHSAVKKKIKKTFRWKKIFALTERRRDSPPPLRVIDLLWWLGSVHATTDIFNVSTHFRHRRRRREIRSNLFVQSSKFYLHFDFGFLSPPPNCSFQADKQSTCSHWALVVALLVERSIQIPEIRRSNPVVVNFEFTSRAFATNRFKRLIDT